MPADRSVSLLAAMEWYYAKDKKQHGPIDQQRLLALAASGEIGPQTLVWREGMSGWQPYEATVPPAIPGGGSGHACVVCRRMFPESELINFSSQWVCAACKPSFFQRLKETGDTAYGGLWRSGSVLVMTREASLPDRCVKCNQPVHGSRLKRKLFWHHPGFYLILLLNVLIYVIVAALAGKRATIHIGICERHRRKRWIGIAVGWGSVVAGILIMVFAAGTADPGPVVGLGILTLLIGGITGLVMASVVTARKIEPDYLHVSGVCSDFLKTLPEWTGGK